MTVDLGVGIGWRFGLQQVVEALPVDFVEVLAESVQPARVPAALLRLRSLGLPVVPHGVSLSLGGAERPDGTRLAHLAGLAAVLEAPLVSEHVAYVRAGGTHAGHLLPVPHTRDALRVISENVVEAMDRLPVPLALENVATWVRWPEDEMDEIEFLAELVERTGVLLLLDVANLVSSRHNLGLDAVAALDRLPLASVAYVHVAGGEDRAGRYHDTHAHPVTVEVLDLLGELAARRRPPGVLLERDYDFPPADELAAELALIRDRLSPARSVR